MVRWFVEKQDVGMFHRQLRKNDTTENLILEIETSKIHTDSGPPRVMSDALLRGQISLISRARLEHLSQGTSLETMTGSTRLGSCHTAAGLQSAENILPISAGHVSEWSLRKVVEHPL